MSSKPGTSARLLWLALWVSFAMLVLLEMVDAWRRSVPALLWVAWLVPLLILLPGLLRARLRSVTWLAFVTLLYFVLAVLRLFAEPESVRALLELVAVISLFLSAGFFVRVRGRELNIAAEASAPAESPNDGSESEV